MAGSSIRLAPQTTEPNASPAVGRRVARPYQGAPARAIEPVHHVVERGGLLTRDIALQDAADDPLADLGGCRARLNAGGLVVMAWVAVMTAVPAAPASTARVSASELVSLTAIDKRFPVVAGQSQTRRSATTSGRLAYAMADSRSCGARRPGPLAAACLAGLARRFLGHDSCVRPLDDRGDDDAFAEALVCYRGM